MGWKSVSIIGVGLMGGSIGLALRGRNLAEEVVGIGHRQASLDRARELGTVSRTTTDLEQGVAEAELVIVCTPVRTIPDFAVRVAELARAGTLITDVGSTKGQVLDEIARRWPSASRATFIGSHPLAGSEKTGPEAAQADLLENRLVVVTPTPHTPPEPLERLERFWESLGARIARTSPAEHDAILATTSHLPHVVAAALSAVVPPAQLPFTAGGWRDTTRIAGADPELWTQILLDNQPHVLKSLDNFGKVLADLRAALADGDEPELMRLLTAGKQRRDALGS
jgi:prephenate dehydrogenase